LEVYLEILQTPALGAITTRLNRRPHTFI